MSPYIYCYGFVALWFCKRRHWACLCFKIRSCSVASLCINYMLFPMFFCRPIKRDGLWLPDCQICCTQRDSRVNNVWVYCFFFHLTRQGSCSISLPKSSSSLQIWAKPIELTISHFSHVDLNHFCFIYHKKCYFFQLNIMKQDAVLILCELFSFFRKWQKQGEFDGQILEVLNHFTFVKPAA